MFANFCRKFIYGVLYKLVFISICGCLHTWSLIVSNLHISLFHSVTMPASLLHAKNKSAAL